MKTDSSKTSFGLLLASAALAVAALPAQAEDFARAGHWGVAAEALYLTSGEATATVGGLQVGAKLDGIYGGGIGLSYDMTERWTLGMDLWGGSGTLKAGAMGVTGSDSIGALGGNLGLDFNILKSRFTPFVGANVGFLTLMGDANGVTGSETDLTYGGGGGVRWDINDRWNLKLTYRANWTQLQGFDDLTLLHTVTLALGFRF